VTTARIASAASASGRERGTWPTASRVKMTWASRNSAGPPKVRRVKPRVASARRCRSSSVRSTVRVRLDEHEAPGAVRDPLQAGPTLGLAAAQRSDPDKRSQGRATRETAVASRCPDEAERGDRLDLTRRGRGRRRRGSSVLARAATVGPGSSGAGVPYIAVAEYVHVCRLGLVVAPHDGMHWVQRRRVIGARAEVVPLEEQVVRRTRCSPSVWRSFANPVEPGYADAHSDQNDAASDDQLDG
jgi:hypothetical protein